MLKPKSRLSLNETFFCKIFSVGIISLIIFSFSIFVLGAADVTEPGFNDSKKQLKQAKKMLRKGRLNEAEKVVRKILENNPQIIDARLILAQIFIKQKKLIEGYNLAFDIAKVDSENSLAFAIMGDALLGVGNFRDAEISYRNALLIDKKEAFAWAGYGMLDFHENRLENSIKKLKSANFYKTNEPDFVFALAKVSARAEKYKEAAAGYRKFLRISDKSDKDRRDRIRGLIKFLEFLGKRQSLYTVGGESKTSVLMDIQGNRPLVEVKINGHEEPLKFVLDTGSGMTVISERTAQKLKIRPVAKGGMARAIGGDGKFQIVYGFLKQIEIGEAKVKNVPVYIRKFHTPRKIVDGYIGISLLSKFLTTIDYGNLKFTLINKSEVDIEETEQNTQGSPLPLRLTTSGFLSGLVKLEGVEDPFSFIIDTGASISVISMEIAKLEEIKKYEQEQKMRVFGAAGVTEGVSSFLLPRVTFGKFSRDSLTAIALDLDVINETTGFEQTGILGGNFLRNYRVTFDFKASKVVFVPINN